MAWDTALPYGMRDIGVRSLPPPYTTPGSLTDLPNSRQLSFEEAEEFEELRGDDKIVAIRGQGPQINWEMEAGGIAIPAYAIMDGGASVTSGTTPNQVNTFTKKVTDARPYFKLGGAAISDSGGDFQTSIYKARASENLGGELGDGAFWLTGVSGTALGSNEVGKTDVLYEFLLRESGTGVVA